MLTNPASSFFFGNLPWLAAPQRFMRWELMCNSKPRLLMGVQMELVFSSEQPTRFSFTPGLPENDLRGACIDRTADTNRFLNKVTEYLNAGDAPVYYFIVYRRKQGKRYVSRRYNLEQVMERAAMEIKRKNTVMVMARMTSGQAHSLNSGMLP